MADVVVVNGDPAIAYRTLLTAKENPPRVRHLRYSPSCVVLHAGSSAAYAHTAHHTIEFGAAWDRTFQEIITDGLLMSDPSFLVTTPTKSDSGSGATRQERVLRPVPGAEPRTSPAYRLGHRSAPIPGSHSRHHRGPGISRVSVTRSRWSGS